jgi:hypothetical protein
LQQWYPVSSPYVVMQLDMFIGRWHDFCRRLYLSFFHSNWPSYSKWKKHINVCEMLAIGCTVWNENRPTYSNKHRKKMNWTESNDIVFLDHINKQNLAMFENEQSLSIDCCDIYCVHNNIETTTIIVVTSSIILCNSRFHLRRTWRRRMLDNIRIEVIVREILANVYHRCLLSNGRYSKNKP